MRDENVMRVVLLRHGKTAANLEKRYAGRRSDASLCSEGVRELEAFAPRLRALIGDGRRVFSGALKRCVESARILFPDVEPTVVEDLTEIDFGDFEGKTYAELADDPRYQAWLESGGTTPFPGGESRSDFIRRSVESLEKAIEAAIAGRFETTAFVCCCGAIMAFMSRMTGGEYFDFQVPPCGGYETTIRKTSRGFELESFNRVDDRLRA